MTEINNISTRLIHTRSKEVHSIENATEIEDAFIKVMSKKKKKNIYATSITMLSNNNYVVDTLILKDEHKSKEDIWTEEKTVYVLARILEVIS